MKHSHTVDDIINGKVKPPFQLGVLPNYMGISLCQVERISWETSDKGGLKNFTVELLDTPKPLSSDKHPGQRELRGDMVLSRARQLMLLEPSDRELALSNMDQVYAERVREALTKLKPGPAIAHVVGLSPSEGADPP